MWIRLSKALEIVENYYEPPHDCQELLEEFLQEGFVSARGCVEDKENPLGINEVSLAPDGLLVVPEKCVSILTHKIDPRSFLNCSELNFVSGFAEIPPIRITGLEIFESDLRSRLRLEQNDLTIRRERLTGQLEEEFSTFVSLKRGDLKNRIRELVDSPELQRTPIPKLNLCRSSTYKLIEEVLLHSPALAVKVVN